MERNLYSYLRQILALCFVLAGLLIFAEQAHCLTMQPEFTSFHDIDHEADGHHHMASKNSHCHHDSGRTAHASWTFLQQPNGTLPVPPLATAPVHLGKMLLAARQPAEHVSGNRLPPPENWQQKEPSILATTSRLLI